MKLQWGYHLTLVRIVIIKKTGDNKCSHDYKWYCTSLHCLLATCMPSLKTSLFGLLLSFFFFLIFIFTLFYFTILHWFCHTLTWIHHGGICILLFPTFLRSKLRLFTIDVSSLLICVFNTLNFPVSSSFAVSQKYWHCILIFN